MYESGPAPYCYPGSGVLRNMAELADQADLDRFEAVMTAARFLEPLPDGTLGVTHYKRIHHHLFQDVYDGAGKYRTVRIAKGESIFCYPEHIRDEMRRLFDWLKRQKFLRGLDAEEFSRAAVHFLTELNAIHPFREGNGRTQLAFLAVLAAQAGHPLQQDRLEPEAVLEAMIASFGGNEAPLGEAICMLNYDKKGEGTNDQRTCEYR